MKSFWKAYFQKIIAFTVSFKVIMSAVTTILLIKGFIQPQNWEHTVLGIFGGKFVLDTFGLWKGSQRLKDVE